MPSRTRRFPARPESAAEGRKFVLESTDGRVPEPLREASLLLASELIANAVRHAGTTADDEIELAVSLDDLSLRVVVRDPGPGFDPGRNVERTSQGGWGLQLVEALASRWGIKRQERGTDVWFELEINREPGGIAERQS